MTCKEKIEKIKPHLIGEHWNGGVLGCPHQYGLLDKPENCSTEMCTECWNREIKEEKKEEEKAENMNDELKRLYKIEERVETVKDFVRTQDFVTVDHILAILGIGVDKKGENA